jgi:hypothetical protein
VLNTAQRPRIFLIFLGSQHVWQNIKPIFGFAYRPKFMVSTIYFLTIIKKIIYNAQTTFGKQKSESNFYGTQISIYIYIFGIDRETRRIYALESIIVFLSVISRTGDLFWPVFFSTHRIPRKILSKKK